MKTSASAALLLLGFGVFAQTTLTPENLWNLDRVHSVQVSPNGKTVIYAQTAYDLTADKGTTHLMSVPATGGQPKMIGEAAANYYEPQWRPDGKKIGYLSATSGSMQLWEMNPDGSGARQITNIEGGISNVRYAPDMKHISYSKEVKVGQTQADKHPDLSKASGRVYNDLMFRHWTQWEDGNYQHIFFAPYADDITDGRDILQGPFDAPMMPFGGTEQTAWSPDGKCLVYVCKKMSGKEYATSTNSDLWLYDLNTKQTTNITMGLAGYDNEPVFSPDGRWLTWLSMQHDGFESDKNVVWMRNMATGMNFPLTREADQSFGSLTWAADGKSLYVISAIQATQQVYKLELAADRDILRVTKTLRVTGGDHDINSIALSGDMLIGTKTTMSKPSEVYAWDIKTGKEKQLSNANNEKLAGIRMGKVEKRMVKTTDGKSMLTWVVYPPDFDPAKKYPTLLYCQGGPQSAVSQFFSYRWNFQLMAAKGYIVVAPNRRGLPGFGQAWNDQISKDWGGQAIKDYLSAIDDVSKEPYVDKDKLGAVGASYGGYSVYYLAGIHDKRFKCFISHCGLYNLESWYASTEELFFANWDIGGPYWDASMKDAYLKNSPHRMVQNWDTPILVIHNELDFRVPLNQGLEAFTAAQLRGIPSRLLYYPDEGHWVSKPQNSVMWHREFFDWLDVYLK